MQEVSSEPEGDGAASGRAGSSRRENMAGCTASDAAETTLPLPYAAAAALPPPPLGAGAKSGATGPPGAGTAAATAAGGARTRCAASMC